MVNEMFNAKMSRIGGFANSHHSLPSRWADQPILRQLAKSWVSHDLSHSYGFLCRRLMICTQYAEGSILWRIKKNG